jgi:hypothetical protein
MKEEKVMKWGKRQKDKTEETKSKYNKIRLERMHSKRNRALCVGSSCILTKGWRNRAHSGSNSIRLVWQTFMSLFSTFIGELCYSASQYHCPNLTFAIIFPK